MGTSPNPLSNRNDLENRKHSAKCTKVLTKYFNDWRTVWPTHEVTKAQLAFYLSMLESLSITELERGCHEVGKRVSNFPKPAEIIDAAKSYTGAEEFAGPKMIEYLEVTDAEREAAIAENAEFTSKLKAQLGKPGLPLSPSGKQITIVPPIRTLEEQKAELARRGYLSSSPHSPACLCPNCRTRRERIQ